MQESEYVQKKLYFCKWKPYVCENNQTPIYMKKVLLLLLVLAVIISTAQAQGAADCDFQLLAEGDFKCILETSVNDNIAVLRACRGNNVCYFVHGGTALSYTWEAVGGEALPDPDDPKRCCVHWGNDNEGYVTVTALYADGSHCEAGLSIILGDSPTARCTTQPIYTVNIENPEIKTLRVCMGDSITLADISLPGTTPITSYYWEYPGGISTTPTIGFVPTTSGAYRILHRIYNECGCYGEEVILLQVDEVCPFELSCHGTVCGGTLATYWAMGIDCSDYVWDVTGGEILTGQHSNTISVQWGEPANGYGVVSLDGGPCYCQCKSRKSTQIPIISGNVDIDGPDVCCEDEDYVFAMPLWGATEYSWIVTPSSDVTQSASESINKARYNFTEPGTYTIKVTYLCPFLSCGPNTATKQVTVKKKLQITTAYPSEVCNGTEVAFSSSAGAATHWHVLYGEEPLEVNDSLGAVFSYRFNEPGFYTIEAQCNGYCKTDRFLLHVLPRTPQPLVVTGPHLVCPNSTVGFDATPISADYVIEWAWVDDQGDSIRYWGNPVNIPFGNTVHDIVLWQTDRRTGCRSLPLTYEVESITLQPWPYPSEIHVCDGQTLILDRIEDQSDVVLYRWQIDNWQEAPLLSIQDDHLKPSVTARVNHTSPHIPYADLRLERRYCNLAETKIIRIIADGVLDPPQVSVPDPACANIETAWVIDDATAQENVDTTQSFWLLDNTVHVPLHAPDTTYYTFQSSQTGQHTIRLHYVSRFGGCNVETQDITIDVYDFPYVWIDASTPGQLCVLGAETYIGTSFHWSTGAYGPCIEYTSGEVSCIVTYGNCSRTLVYKSGGIYSGCDKVYNAFNVEPVCMNNHRVTINDPTINLPVSLTVATPSGNETISYTIETNPQVIIIPFQGATHMHLLWYDNGNCRYSDQYYQVSCIYKLDINRDCSTGEMVATNKCTCTTATSLACEVWNENDNMVGLGYFNAINNELRFNILPDGSLYHVRLYDIDNPNCLYEVEVHHGPIPAVASINVPSNICEDAPLHCSASAIGDITEYRWVFGDGSYNFGETIDHVYKAGAHPLTLIVTDKSGCTAACSTNVVAHKYLLDGGTVSQNSLVPVCSGNSVQLHYSTELLNNNLYNQYGNYTATFQWFPDDGDMGNLDIAYVNHGGRVLVKETSYPGGCTHWADVYVNYPNPIASDISCKAQYCKGETATLYGYAGPDRQYQWTVTDPLNVLHTSIQPDYTLTFEESGLYSAQLTVIQSTCTNSVNKTFTVQEVLAPTIAFDGGWCIDNSPVKLKSFSGDRLNWSNGAYGTEAFFYYAGPAGAYYRDPATGCRSDMTSIAIPRPPNMGALLTGCYNRCKKEIYEGLQIPLYDCALLSMGPWQWWGDNIVLSSGTGCSSYPEILPIPSAGTYSLSMNICEGNNFCCTFHSPTLEINAANCGEYSSMQDYLDNLPLTIKKANVTCSTQGCDLSLWVTMTLDNSSGNDLTIGSITGCPISGVSPSLPTILLNGYSMNLTLYLGFVPSGIYSINVYGTDGRLLGYTLMGIPDWSKCIETTGCDLDIGVFMSLNNTRTVPGQTVYLDYSLTMPSSVSNVVAVWSEEGQVLWSSFLTPSATGTLVLDYGWLTQAVLRDDSVCLHVICCQNGGEWCKSDVCISTRCLYAVTEDDDCTEVQQQERKSAPQKSSNTLTRLTLRPNPTIGKTDIIDAVTGTPARDISVVRVMSILGTTIFYEEGTHSIDLTNLTAGTYIVTVYTSNGDIEHLKLTKK